MSAVHHQDTTDWKRKYYEATDLLAETKGELDDFQTASKELEEELERELQRTESEKERLRLISSKAETECSEWKDKFIHLQTLHNTTTSSLQRDLDTCRQEYHTVKVHMRELEMGNDNLERNERAVASTLAELEVKYSKALEEKILLEHELMDKANLEETLQRLRDELRDAYEEVESLKHQLSKEDKAASVPPTLTPKVARVSEEESNLKHRSTMAPTQDGTVENQPHKSSLLNKEPSGEPSSPTGSRSLEAIREKLLSRSNTLPPTSSLPKRNPLPQQLLGEKPPFPRKGSTSSTVSTLPAAKSKGVQMVSEMRARVRNLELKIHSRVPRLRMGSFSRSTSPRYLKSPGNESNTPSTNNRPSIDQLSIGSRSRTSVESNNRQGAESPGWVLILEETPVRKVRKDGEHPNRGMISRSPNPIMSSGHAGRRSDSDAPAQDFHRSGNLRHRLQAHAPTPRPLTPTALPVPTQRASPSTFHLLHQEKPDADDLNLTMKTSVLKKSTRSVGGATSKSTDVSQRRRQSAGSNASGQSDAGHERINPRNGRSSLPNAFTGAAQLTAGGAEVEPRQTDPSAQVLGDTKSSNSVGTSIFARSRIGKPARRTSGGAIPPRRISTGHNTGS